MDKVFETIFSNYLTILTLMVVFFLGLFLYSWLKEPRRLINGVIFQIFFVLLILLITILIFSANNPLFLSIFGWTVLIVFALIGITIALSWLLLLWNSYFVWKRESHSLANSLTLLLGIGILLFWFISLFNLSNILPKWVMILLSGAPFIFIYLELTMLNFLINLTFYQFVPKRLDQNYLIVLGAGLINGDKVSPLLMNRITAAVNFNNKQLAKNHSPAELLMSGGQGNDEKLPESVAMKAAAVENGVNPNQILVEDQSKNTYQNMAYSKRILTDNFGSPNFKAMFVTNNYHTFRAGLLAKEAGLKANGIGAKTRFYFLPNAILREFAAVFMMNKKRHFIIIGTIIILSILSALFEIVS